MLEFVDADRCENCHHSSAAAFLRQLPCRASQGPSSPIEADRYRHYRADRYALQEALERLALENRRNLHCISLPGSASSRGHGHGPHRNKIARSSALGLSKTAHHWVILTNDHAHVARTNSARNGSLQSKAPKAREVRFSCGESRFRRCNAAARTSLSAERRGTPRARVLFGVPPFMRCFGAVLNRSQAVPAHRTRG